jgi:hypothetical protein
MIEKFKNIFEGLDRAHGVTIVGESNGNGAKDQSLVVHTYFYLQKIMYQRV